MKRVQRMTKDEAFEKSWKRLKIFARIMKMRGLAEIESRIREDAPVFVQPYWRRLPRRRR